MGGEWPKVPLHAGRCLRMMVARGDWKGAIGGRGEEGEGRGPGRRGDPSPAVGRGVAGGNGQGNGGRADQCGGGFSGVLGRVTLAGFASDSGQTTSSGWATLGTRGQELEEITNDDPVPG